MANIRNRRKSDIESEGGAAVADPEAEQQAPTSPEDDEPEEDDEEEEDEEDEEEDTAEAAADIANEVLNLEGGEANAALDAQTDAAERAPYITRDGVIEPIPYGVPLVAGKKVRAKVYTLKLADIFRDSRIQPRDRMDDAALRDYAEQMADGQIFPPVVVFREETPEGVINWLADGWHRVYAAERAELPSVKAEIYAGGLNEAALYAAGANATHGLRRSNADKIRSVEMLLNHPTVIEQQWSDNRIAKQCGVSHVTVGNVRRRLHPDEIPTSRLGHDGRVHNVRHRLDVREQNEAAKESEAPDQVGLYACGAEGCPEVLAVPSVHCDTCGEHYAAAEYDACPSCTPETADTGNGRVSPVATLVDAPVDGDLSVDMLPVDLPDHGGALPAISEAHAALRALVTALDVCQQYAATTDPNKVAVVVDEDAIEGLLEKLANHLDWVDGIETALKARRPTAATV